METTIQHIELINQYLNNLLSGEAKSSFVQKLKSDSEFNILYQEHLILIEGINRAALKQDIANARQKFITTKWIKISGIGIIIIGTLLLLYTLLNLSKSEIEQPQQEQNNAFIQIEDTKKATEKDSVKKDTLRKITVIDSPVETTSNGKEEIKSVMNEPFRKQSQIITFDTTKDTIIKCKEGTVLKIKANSFMHVGTNLPVKGKIRFEVTEYYKLSDIMMANLTTTSNGEQLETGGMLYIEASQGDSLLELKPNSAFDILMPTKNKKESMQLFSGVMGENGIDWSLENDTRNSNSTIAVIKRTDVIEEIIEVPLSIIEEVPTFPGCENGTNTEKMNCLKDSLSAIISKNFNSELASDLKLTGNHKIITVFKINRDGDIMDIEASASHVKLAQEAVRVLELIPKMMPGKQRGRNVIVPYSLPINFRVEGSTKNNPSLIKVKGVKTLGNIIEKKLESDSNSVTTNEISRYILSSAKLGWINCDRFVLSRAKRIKYKLKIKNSENTVVNMIFKSVNSVLPSRKSNEEYDFGTVLDDYDVVLVAIKKEEGKLFMDVIDTKIKANPNIDFEFKEVTLQDMKLELQKLNSLFE